MTDIELQNKLEELGIGPDELWQAYGWLAKEYPESLGGKGTGAIGQGHMIIVGILKQLFRN